MFKNMKLGTKLMLLTVTLTVAGIILLVGLLINSASTMQSKTAEELATAKAEAIANDIAGVLEEPLSEARGISRIFERIDAYIRENRRKRLNTMLKHVLERNENYLAVWSIWEPNALDTLDTAYVNAPGHDATGRFIPYWNRGSGKVEMEPCYDYEKEGAGDYYLLAKKAEKEVIINPYKYVAGGKEKLITSVVVPIKSLTGKFMGVIGIDIELTQLQKKVAGIKIGETGYCYLISNNSLIAAHQKTDFNGGKTRDIEKYTNEGLDIPENVENAVKEGKKFSLEKFSALHNKRVYRTYVPIQIGLTETPWSLAVNQDVDEIMAPVSTMIWESIITSILLVAIICLVIFFLMRNLSKTIERLKDRLQKAIKSVLDGRLDYRPETKEIHNEFVPIISGMSQLMDAFVSPINVTAEYIDRISKGDLPPKITDDYKGDFNEIKNNLNTLIDSLGRFLDEMSQMHKMQVAGELDFYLDPGKFTGFYRQMGIGVNEGVKLHVDNILLILNILKSYSEGDLKPVLKQLPGKQVIANQLMDKLRNTLLELIGELNRMSGEQKAGDYEAKMDADKFQGAFYELANGVNQMIDDINHVMITSFRCMADYSEGNLSTVLEKFPGKRAVANHVADNIQHNIQGVIDETKLLINAAIEGRLDTRGEASKFKGAFRELITGINNTLDAVIGPLNVAAEYVDRIAKGDIPPKITDIYKGDFNELKNNLNQCIDAVNLLVTDAGMLAQAAAEGKLDTRAEANRHQGNFRAIITGVNKTLDNVIGPLNVAAEYMDRIAKGDIPPKISDDYKGDFNEIKNNLNTCISAIELLVRDSVLLSQAATAGDFDKRADISRHQGDFRKIVQGVNGTLDTIVDKIFWFEQLLDSMPNPISVTDMDMKWTFLNKAAESVTGFKRKDILGKHCSNWNADICNTEKCGIACLNKGLSHSFFEQPGMDMFFQVDTHYITNTAGQKIGHIEIVSDITQQKKAEKTQSEARKIAEKVMEFQTEEAEKVTDALTKLMNGDLNFSLETAEGDEDTASVKDIFKQISSALNQTVKAIKSLTADTIKFAEAAGGGDLKYRANAGLHKGEYKAIIEGINNTFDAVIEPINEAGNVLSIMATGDLTARMEGSYEGDLLELKTNINTLGDSLQNLIARVSENVQQSASAAIEITSTAESLAASAQEQSAQADEVSSAVEEMSRTVTENAQSANRTADVAHKNGKMATEGGAVVERTVDKMRDIADVVRNSAENIQKLGESSKQIGEIISVIDDIADQTNLLALNAAIEAARAGEQGRGFAVVADEVRKLAERTTEATKQIAKMIKGIQEETEAAVKAMNRGNDEVRSGIDLADQAGRSLHEILSSTQEVLDMINQIAAASEEQSATSEQISKNVLSISKVTAESARRIEDVAHSADGLSKMTEQLTELMSHFKIDADMSYSGMGGSGMKRFASVQKKHLPSGK